MSPPTSACTVSAPLLKYLRRRRELEQDARHARVLVELAQQPLDLVVARVGGQPVVEALDADLGGRPLLAADVLRRRRVIADQHGRQAGRVVAGLHPRGDVLRHLGAHLLGDRLSVDDPGRHQGAGG